MRTNTEKPGFRGFLSNTPSSQPPHWGKEKAEMRGMNICDVPDSFYLRYRRAPKQIDRKCVIVLLMTSYRKLSVYIWRRH